MIYTVSTIRKILRKTRTFKIHIYTVGTIKEVYFGKELGSAIQAYRQTDNTCGTTLVWKIKNQSVTSLLYRKKFVLPGYLTVLYENVEHVCLHDVMSFRYAFSIFFLLILYIIFPNMIQLPATLVLPLSGVYWSKLNLFFDASLFHWPWREETMKPF